MTTYYRFVGKIVKRVVEDEDDYSHNIDDWDKCTRQEVEPIAREMFIALSEHVRKSDGWRFVDVSGFGTVTKAEYQLEWSDYGQTVPLIREASADYD
jgi:hypothetical protein